MMTTRLLYRKFHWEWRFALIMGSLFLVFISLGYWQLQREAQKRVLLSQVEQAESLPPLEFSSQSNGRQLASYQPIRVTGTYLNRHQFLLDNQFSNHHVGYHVLTPMRIGSVIVLVNRGWVPRQLNRDDLPVLKPIKGPVTVVGYATQSTAQALRLSSAEDNPHQWPRVIETIDWDQIAQALHHPVLPWTLRMKASEPNGYLRDWSLSWMSPDRHRGYAVQWFIFAGLAVVIFVARSLGEYK